MKVAISCKGTTLEDPADRRFGRCPVFLIVDTDTLNVDVLENEASHESLGAGMTAAKLLTRQEVDAVITGNLGPNAVRILESEGVPVYVGATGTAGQALRQHRSGRLPRATATAGRRMHMMRGPGAPRQGKIRAIRSRKGRGPSAKPEGNCGNGSRGGFPPTAGFHAGTEPTLPEDDEKE